MSKKSSPIRLLPIVIMATLLVCGFKLADRFLFDQTVAPAIGSALAQGAAENDAAMEEAVEEDVLDPEATGEFADDDPDIESEVDDGLFLTPAEQDVLESLQERRQELEQREVELELRERLLEAAEQRIEERIDELRLIEGRIEATFGEQAENRREQMQNLVGLYENMKPKDAATIFNRLAMGVLIGVAEQMQTRRMAPILARMDPAVAERLTVELAARAEALAATPELEELEAGEN